MKGYNVMKEIILTFGLDTGETQVETKGFSGPSCKAASDFVVKALGESSDFKKKAEWFSTNMKMNHGNLNTNLCG